MRASATLNRTSIRSLWEAFVRPVRPEARRTVRQAWERLSPQFRVDWQIVGQQEEGCGATIGVMPRCDFGCQGCYLGLNANQTPPLDLENAKAQMRLLRKRLGVWGNLQLTDGEVTLRPVKELIELMRYAREIKLIPMLMTHGDSFRRRPGLLERLMVEGGLVELSIHIDSTQRGRWGDQYRNATCESQLMPLRDEYAEMIRRARRATRRPLRAASTVTVVAQNLPEVGDIVRWFRQNADAFRIVSFQPAAQVGRTRPGTGGAVDPLALWGRIAEGLGGEKPAVEKLLADQWWFGHPACSRLISGLVTSQPGKPNRYELVSMFSDPLDRRFLGHVFKHWGGISFREGGSLQHAARVLGMVRQTPGFFLHTFPRFAWNLLRRLDPNQPARLALRLLTGSAHLHPLTIVSHHFMSPQEINTPEGQERIANCVFMVPIDGELVSMCQVNATDLRDRFYEQIKVKQNRSTGGSRVSLTVEMS